MTFDLSTGAATILGPISPDPGTGFGAGLEVDLSTGTMWAIADPTGVPPGGPSNIFTINPTTLAARAIAQADDGTAPTTTDGLRFRSLAIDTTCAAAPVTAAPGLTG